MNLAFPRRVVACLVAGSALSAGAQTPAGPGSKLTDLSLEQLTSIEVTTVGKRVQRLADVPGSVFVISQEDIRRTGAVTLPELLRLAPNLQVSRADANQYAISARGFTSVLANKMLVLVDGRTVYSPLFSGVFWEAQDVVLEDIERIEVLSGASGTLYGSNAVNGVISIITRSAADTHGLLATARTGSQDKGAAVRYGASADADSYRVYAKRTLRDNSELANGTAVRDAASRSQAGFRGDRSVGNSHWTVQGDIYTMDIDQVPAARTVSGLNLLARASQDFGTGSHAQVQVYFDRTVREQPGTIHDALNTWDIEAQHLFSPWPGHDFLYGAGWRMLDDRLENKNPALLAFLPPNRRQQLWNVFAQDEFDLRDDLRLTLGLKAEHNGYTGLEWLPNARLAWEVAPNHLAWITAARAVRVPSRIDREYFAASILGGPNFDSEATRMFELGARGQPTPGVNWSVALFHHRFDRLRSVDTAPGGFTINNNFQGRLSGVESWGQWRVTERWRLKAGYVRQSLSVTPRAGTAPAFPASSEGNDAPWRASLGASWDFARNMELDVQVRRIGALPAPVVPAYTAVDLRWGWRVRPDLDLSLVVRNAGGSHAEFGAAASRAEFGRNMFLKAVWRM